MLTDDDLVRIAYRAVFGFSRDWDMTTPADQRRWIAAIPALRAALVPDVAPLAPGETVLIDGESPVQWIEAGTMRDQPGLFFVTGGANLDAAGVRALRTACDRFLAGQEDT